MDITFVTTAKTDEEARELLNYWECRLAKAKGGIFAWQKIVDCETAKKA